MLRHFSCVLLCVTLWTVAHQAPLSMGFSRQESWSGLLFPSPGNLPNPRIEPASLRFPALAGRFFSTSATWASLVAQLVKNPPAVWENWVRSLGWEDPLEKGMATHSSILAWRIPQSMGSQRVGQDWVTFTCILWNKVKIILQEIVGGLHLVRWLFTNGYTQSRTH